MDLISAGMGVVQITFQFVAAGLTYAIYQKNKIERSWLAMTAAFTLMGFRRITALLTSLGYLPKLEASLLWLDRVLLPFLITCLLLWGTWTLFRRFAVFSRVRRKRSK